MKVYKSHLIKNDVSHVLEHLPADESHATDFYRLVKLAPISGGEHKTISEFYTLQDACLFAWQNRFSYNRTAFISFGKKH